MRLRTRLIVLNSLVVLGGALLALLLLEHHARRELRNTEEQRLLGEARLLAERAQIRISTELVNLQTWADMPLVVQMALHPDDDALRNALSTFLQGVVQREQRYSIYLFSREGECIASDDPRRIGSPMAREIVAKRPSMKRALAGQACIGESLFSKASGRPLVALSAPVWHKGNVIGVLRTAVDMLLLQNQVFPPVPVDDTRRVYIDDPEMDKTLAADIKLLAPDIDPPWRPPPPPIVRAGREAVGSVYYYDEQGKRLLIGSAPMNDPAWVVFVTQSMDKVLAPLDALHRIAMLTIVALGVLVASATRMLVAPVVVAIERCRDLVSAFREGRLEQRLFLRRSDEIGDLAGGLNRMAEALDRSRRDLAAAEREYRALFEKAIEGIFRTDVNGTITLANAAMADILGADSTETLIGKNAHQFYARPGERDRILDLLRQHGRIDGKAVQLVRIDGGVRDCEVSARAEHDADGIVQSLQGILVDITEMRAAELAREKARETERLLTEARWLSLRYQVNPHFLFNVLTSIEALSREAPDRIPDLTRQLGVFLRKTQCAGVTPLIPLREELKGVKAYLNIEKVRFEERLQIDIDVSERLLDLPVPDMLVQPLVENAIKFGMATSGMPLKIRIAAGITDAGDVRIEVANTGKWVPEDAQRDHEPIGQANLRNRLHLLYAGSFALKSYEEKGWVRVEILLPGRWGA